MFCKNNEAALVAAMAVSVVVGLSGCYALMGECSGSTCVDASASVDGAGKDAGSLGEAKDSFKTDGSGTDSDVAGPQDDSAEMDVVKADTPIATDKGPPKPLCPPDGKPERTVELQVNDGPGCFAPGTEVTSAQQLNGAKLLAEDCGTFMDPKDCEALVKVMSSKYQPEKYSKPPQYDGHPMLVITFPYDPEWWLEVAITGYEGTKAYFETPLWEDGIQYSGKYDSATKRVIILRYKNGKENTKMIFLIV